MVLTIERGVRQNKPIWVVHAYGMDVRFSDQTSAANYASKLEERVNAPHVIPLETRKHWAVEQSRMLRGF